VRWINRFGAPREDLEDQLRQRNSELEQRVKSGAEELAKSKSASHFWLTRCRKLSGRRYPTEAR